MFERGGGGGLIIYRYWNAVDRITGVLGFMNLIYLF